MCYMTVSRPVQSNYNAVGNMHEYTHMYMSVHDIVAGRLESAYACRIMHIPYTELFSCH